jgi:ubiquinone/menaquinone biosynthesis C-methylase UbiE
VINHFAFHEFSDSLATLKEMHRLLKSGGFAVIQDLRRPSSFMFSLLRAYTYLTSPFGRFGRQYLSSLRAAYREQEILSLARAVGFKTSITRSWILPNGVWQMWAAKPKEA